MSSTKERIPFTYESVSNVCRLLATIQYEKSHSVRNITVFHQIFKGSTGDKFIEQFLSELFPNGATIGEDELKALNLRIEKFMSSSKIAQDLFVEYDKRHYKSYVYFKPDNVVIPARVGEHNEIVQNICLDYFKDFQTVELEYLKKFIRDNFEISSDFTSIEQVVADAKHIKNMIDRYS